MKGGILNMVFILLTYSWRDRIMAPKLIYDYTNFFLLEAPRDVALVFNIVI